MEDLSPAGLEASHGRPFLEESVPSQLVGIGVEDARPCIAAMARWHGRFWGRSSRAQREVGPVAPWALSWQEPIFQATASLVFGGAVKKIPEVWARLNGGEKLPHWFMEVRWTTARVHHTRAPRSLLTALPSGWYNTNPPPPPVTAHQR
jgi:hypothetical protein